MEGPDRQGVGRLRSRRQRHRIPRCRRRAPRRSAHSGRDAPAPVPRHRSGGGARRGRRALSPRARSGPPLLPAPRGGKPALRLLRPSRAAGLHRRRAGRFRPPALPGFGGRRRRGSGRGGGARPAPGRGWRAALRERAHRLRARRPADLRPRRRSAELLPRLRDSGRHHPVRGGRQGHRGVDHRRRDRMGPCGLGPEPLRRLGDGGLRAGAGGGALRPSILGPVPASHSHLGPPAAADPAPRNARGQGCGVRDRRRLGAGVLVRPRRAARPRPAESSRRRALARGGAQGMRSGARSGRRHGSRGLHQVRGPRTRRHRVPGARVLRHDAEGREGEALLHADSEGDDPERGDDRAPGRAPVPAVRADARGTTGFRLAPPLRAARRLGRARHGQRARRGPARDGAALAGSVVEADERRPFVSGRTLDVGGAVRGRGEARHRASRLLCRGARLGAAPCLFGPPRGVRCRP